MLNIGKISDFFVLFEIYFENGILILDSVNVIFLVEYYDCVYEECDVLDI